jgi:uncharacterized protein (TIGR00369 family)
VGIEINANHLRSISNGMVEARAELVHRGAKLHVWNVEIYDKENRKLICTGRLTNMIVPHR